MKLPQLIVGALVVLHVALAVLWVQHQELPMGTRDEFFLVAEAVEIAWQLETVPLSQLHVYPLLVMKAYYPPLCRLPGVAALLLGGNYDAMVAAQWFWLLFLVGGTWFVAKKIGGPWAAVTAVGLLLAAPSTLDSLHRYEPNLGAMACGACVLAAWLYSRDLQARQPTLLLGLFVGLGLMSDRLGVLPFLVGPLLVSVARTRNRGSLQGLLIVVVGAAAVAGWWYLDFFARFAQELVPQLLSGEISAVGAPLEDRPPGLLQWLHYLLLWPDTQLGLLGGSAALLGLGWAIRFRKEPGVGDLLLWLALGLLLFTLIPKRQPFYTLPLLPAAVSLAAAFLCTVARRIGRAGAALPVAVVLGATIPAVVTTQPDIPDYNPGLMDWLINNRSPLPERWMGERFNIGVQPQDMDLDLEDNFALLARAGVGPEDLVLVFADDGMVNESSLWSFGRIARGSDQVLGVTLDPQAVLERGQSAAALIFVHQLPVPWPETSRLVAAHERFFGFDEDYRPLVATMERLQVGARHLETRRLSTESSVSTWLLGGR